LYIVHHHANKHLKRLTSCALSGTPLPFLEAGGLAQKAAQSAISWRNLQSANIEFTMKRLREPIEGRG
jgi:hypothetical protein